MPEDTPNYSCAEVFQWPYTANMNQPPSATVDVEHFGRCLNLSTNCHDCLAQVKRPQHVDTIIMNGCDDLADADFRSLCQFTSLRRLALLFCEQLTSEAMAYVCRISSLRHLDLTGSSQIMDGTNSASVQISSLRHLETLNLSFLYSISDVDLASVATLPLLRAICLESCEHITDEGIKSVCSLPHLEVLELPRFADVTDDAMQSIARNARQLRELWLRPGTMITDSGLASLATCENLERIVLDGVTTLSLSAASAFRSAKRLRHVTLIDVHVDDTVMAELRAGQLNVVVATHKPAGG